MKIKNIILDLGGVLLNLNYHLTTKAFENLGIKNFESLYAQAQQSAVFNDLEKGLISGDEFVSEIQKLIPEPVTEKQIIDAWNAMLLDFPKERFDFLLELKKKYNTVLLSNTNTIHLEFFSNYLEKTYQIKDLQDYFNHLYYSCDLKMRKPDKEIFEKVCELENFIPEETLFIDDSIQHVHGAKSLGINAYWLDLEKEDVVQLLERVL